ncbi:MAG TPA: trypsin-like peptidase domain-containing protein [Ktedonobacterales bacterium]|nr:trypsin-like peptidase domain-containing protein [Ktedonobacterales bacterium]
MESPEKHTDLSQPLQGAPSEQYMPALEPETPSYLSPDNDYTVPLQPGYAQPADVTQPNVIAPMNAGAGVQPPARRRSWKAYALGGVVLLILMLASFGVGSALVNKPSGSSGNTPGSASNVTLPASVTDLQQTIIEVSNQVQPSVVEVTSVGQSSEAIGSGVILTSNGYIVTNDHVVSGYNSFTVTLSNGTKYSAQLVGQDAQDDLAVLKIAATNLKPITFADSSKVEVGEFALALGSPLGLENSTTFGIVSAVNRTESEAPSGPASELTGLIQTSAAINPGNSGGALVNLQGQLIGMPTLGATNSENGSTADGIGFAIPSNRIKFVTDQLIASGKLTSSGQGFLGIQGQDVTAQLAAADNLSAQQGVLVTGFADDASGISPAQQAGLRAGDVIIAVNGQQISGNDDLAAALLNQTPGTQVTLTIERGSSQQTVKVTLGERPVG